jgi:hypothetical protein
MGDSAFSIYELVNDWMEDTPGASTNGI